MKYILDSSVAFKWVVAEALSDKAQLVRDDYRNAIHELLSPDILPLEVAHALTRAERQGRLTAPQSGILLADVLSTAPKLFSYLPLLRRAIEISSLLRIGVYDCLYVALAEREGGELLTADGRLARHRPTFPFITELSSLP
jgi:predicted nucleic acid-binding protein